MRVAQVPTTLLGMVDAAIGGKTAIDIPEGKNLVGAFHPPDAVFADAGVLATLPQRQLSSGLAEVVKSAFLADRDAVAHVERSLDAVLRGEIGPQVTSVALAAEVKANIVTLDPREAGLRELLNFGHTMGHAYEAASKYRVTHGEAVAIGLVFASALAETLGLAPQVAADRRRAAARARAPADPRAAPARGVGATCSATRRRAPARCAGSCRGASGCSARSRTSPTRRCATPRACCRVEPHDALPAA